MKRILLCVSLLVTSLPLFAQVDLFPSDWRYSSYRKGFDTNQCLQFFFQAKDSGKAKFRSITSTTYYLMDSILAHKRFGGICTARFNKKGQVVFKSTMDSNRVFKDSNRYVFDSKFRKLREITYERNDSLKVILKTDDDSYAYNAKNHIIHDSEVIYYPFGRYGNIEGRRTKTPKRVDEYELVNIHYRYDEAGDMVQSENITKWSSKDRKSDYMDTNYNNYKFDEKHQVLYSEYRSKYGTNEDFSESRYYYKYDEKGHEIFNATVNFQDSTLVLTGYNAAGDKIMIKRYKNGELQYSYIMEMSKDGSYTETIDEVTDNNGRRRGDEFGGDYKKSACPNNEHTVKTYDTGGREVSIVTTKQKNGESIATTYINRYTFENGREIIDSEFTTERSRLHSLTSQRVTTYKYDAKGNVIEETEKGGGMYTENTRTVTTFNAQGKRIGELRYNACVGDKPQEQDIYTYYPDGVTLKKEVYITVSGNITREYLADGKIEREVHDGIEDSEGSYEVLYKYEK